MNDKMVGRKEGSWISRHPKPFSPFGQSTFFSLRRGFLAPCLVLFPQATLKFLWRFAYFCLPLPHASLVSLFLICSSHLGLLPVLLLAGWQVFQALVHTLTNDRCYWSFYHLDFPWHFCSFIEFWVILFLDILGPQSARSLCIIESQDYNNGSNTPCFVYKN